MKEKTNKKENKKDNGKTSFLKRGWGSFDPFEPK